MVSEPTSSASLTFLPGIKHVHPPLLFQQLSASLSFPALSCTAAVPQVSLSSTFPRLAPWPH